MSKRSRLFVLLMSAALVPACVFSTGYQKRGVTYVYATLDEGRGYVEHPIPNIDAGSFQALDKHGYARDDLQVYYHEYAVEGADPGSFTAISESYGRDNASVYYQVRVIPGADPFTFALFDIQWGRDARDVYRQDVPLEACDPATFNFLKDGWNRDDQCVYREAKKLPDGDPDSFVVLNSWFAKDQYNVYSSITGVIAGADPATFELMEGMCEVCAEDANSCYRYEERVDCESLR